MEYKTIVSLISKLVKDFELDPVCTSYNNKLDLIDPYLFTVDTWLL